MKTGSPILNAYGQSVHAASNRLWIPKERRLITDGAMCPQSRPEIEGYPTMTTAAGPLCLEDCPDRFPTDRRTFLLHSVVQAGRADFRTRILTVPGFSGSGETMMGGDLGGIMVTSAVNQGHSDATFLSIEDSGRSTGGYGLERDKLARVTRLDQSRDADRTTTAHIQAGHIEADKDSHVVVVGHSLGQQKGLGAVEAVLRETPARIQAMVNLMGTPESRWGLGRSLKFLSQVWPHSPKAVWQAWLARNGAMDVIEDADAYARAMFGVPVATGETNAHREKAVFDSSHAFLDVTLQWDARHLERLVDQYGDRMREARIVTVMASEDNLIADKTAAQSKRYKRLGIKEDIVTVPTTHSIPVNMTEPQQQAFARAFDLAFQID